MVGGENPENGLAGPVRRDPARPTSRSPAVPSARALRACAVLLYAGRRVGQQWRCTRCALAVRLRGSDIRHATEKHAQIK